MLYIKSGLTLSPFGQTHMRPYDPHESLPWSLKRCHQAEAVGDEDISGLLVTSTQCFCALVETLQDIKGLVMASNAVGHLCHFVSADRSTGNSHSNSISDAVLRADSCKDTFLHNSLVGSADSVKARKIRFGVSSLHKLGSIFGIVRTKSTDCSLDKLMRWSIHFIPYSTLSAKRHIGHGFWGFDKLGVPGFREPRSSELVGNITVVSVLMSTARNARSRCIKQAGMRLILTITSRRQWA